MSFYTRALLKYPILTQSITTAGLFGAGDVIAQQAVEQKGWDRHDTTRTVRMTGFGGCAAGPLLSNWYRFLELNIRRSTPLRTLAARVGLDQLVFAPCFIAFFFAAQGTLEGKTVNEIKVKLEHGYSSALFNNYKLWPAVQFANFYFVPLQHRLLVTNIVALGWNSYLSWVNQRSSTLIKQPLE
ncbi:Mpv17/PMP22 family protein [Hesseltinella vesiculosa]|uniref:Mpv17/PMP22 family protein n=1 Tax=Hesseltinella vesiculosa TaxID=101127 RepID=A0A1X2G8P9_9FUNG|nr:Mpv17/PMP22 family protein [Hesseltinella vesiculosa]